MNPNHQTRTTPEQKLAAEWGIDSKDIPVIPEATIVALRSIAPDDAEDLEMLLDDAATDMLQVCCPQFHENVRIIRAGGGDRERQREARDRQLALFQQAQRYILEIAGLNQELSVDQYERARMRIHEQLVAAKEMHGADFDPLRELGIIIQNAEGKDYFRFPTEVMPKGTADKYQAYLDAVKTHIRTSNKQFSGLAMPHDLKVADEHRKVAHDSIAMDMMRLLGLTDFEEARRLIAKMRDSSFPNTSTGEVARVNRQLEEGLSVVEALRHHVFPGQEYLPDPEDNWYHH